MVVSVCDFLSVSCPAWHPAQTEAQCRSMYVTQPWRSGSRPDQTRPDSTRIRWNLAVTMLNRKKTGNNIASTGLWKHALFWCTSLSLEATGWCLSLVPGFKHIPVFCIELLVGRLWLSRGSNTVYFIFMTCWLESFWIIFCQPTTSDVQLDLKTGGEGQR